MAEYNLTVPGQANTFQHNGSDYVGGDQYQTDDACDALAFYNAFKGTNPDGGRANSTPEFWQTVTLFNPVVYLISGFRWSFYEIADVNVGTSLFMTGLFLATCVAIMYWIFRTGYRLKK